MQPNQSSNLKLIGLVGNAGVGKDTVASYLEDVALDAALVSAFADPVKSICSILFNLSPQYFYSLEFKETNVPEWNLSPRQMAQFVGTEFGREFLSKLTKSTSGDHWIRLFDSLLSAPLHSSTSYVIIPDVRFQNEVDYVVDKGGIILHISRGGKLGDVGFTNHASEQISSLDFTEALERGVYYEVKNNGTILDLYEKVDDVVSVAL